MDLNSMSREGLEFLMNEEGCKQEVYLDAGGKPTIGVGHLLTEEEITSGLIQGKHSYGEGLTYDQCLDVLAEDVERFEDAVNDLVEVDLNQTQFDALVSLCFNIGRGAFARSTLLRVLNQGRYKAVPAQFRAWRKVNGKVVAGLVARREREIALWLTELEDAPLEDVAVDTVAPDDIPLPSGDQGVFGVEDSSLTPSEEVQDSPEDTLFS